MTQLLGSGIDRWFWLSAATCASPGVPAGKRAAKPLPQAPGLPFTMKAVGTGEAACLPLKSFLVMCTITGGIIQTWCSLSHAPEQVYGKQH